MIQWREGRVVSIGRSWPGALELVAALEGGPQVRALAYPALVGAPSVGASVLLNVSALERSLGTGGFALVVACPSALPVRALDGPGHLVKARYTPLQAMVLGVDEQQSAYHALLAEADDLLGMPVVVADLHSSLPAVLAGLYSVAPATRVAYVMSDGGALPAWFSRSIAGLRDAGWLASCITAGQAFGGDHEAVSVHSALLAARHVVSADVAIVIQGPGNLGTGTRWGFSGVAAGEAVNAASVLGGRPVCCLRISGADARPRHRGISHHSLTAYGRVALARADLAVPSFPLPSPSVDVADHGEPDGLSDAGGAASLTVSRAHGDAEDGRTHTPAHGEAKAGEMASLPLTLTEVGALVEAQLPALVAPLGRHRAVRVPLDGLMEALAASPVSLSTMGRGLADDPAAFLAAAAAGRHAAALLAE